MTTRALDPITSLIAYPNLNVKLAGAYAGLSDSYDGGTHNSVSDIAVTRAIPNMCVVCVSDAVQTMRATEAVAQMYGPVYLRLSRAAVPGVFGESYTFRFGKGELLRDGTDVTLIATGYMLQKSLEAAKLLEAEGISTRVVNIHTIKPIDEDIITESAEKTKLIVTVEEHSVIGGLGGAVAEVLAEKCPSRMCRIGINDSFGESGDYESLLAKFGLSSERIAEKVLLNLEKK
jgi:transketolase